MNGRRIGSWTLFLLFLVFSAGLTAGRAEAAAFVAYDTLTTSPIDAGKWSEYEIARVLDSGRVNLGVRSTTESNSTTTSSLKFTSPNAKNRFRATVKVDTFTNPSSIDAPYASTGIGGRFYNDGQSTPGSGNCLGDVVGQVLFGNPTVDGTSTAIYWNVVKYTDSTCTTTEKKDSGILIPSALVGTEYVLSIAWNNGTGTFSFAASDGTITETAQSTWPALNDATRQNPGSPFRGLSSRVMLGPDLTGRNAAVFAHFWNVGVWDGSAYTDYALADSGDLDHISPTNWSTYEYVRAVTDKHLVLVARGTTNSSTYTENILPVKNPENVWGIGATLTAATLSSSDDAAGHAMVGVGGRFFNDGSTGDGYIGDIGATIRLQTSQGGLIGRWKVTRYAGSTDFDQEQLSEDAKGDLGSISLNKAYKASVLWDGTKFTFSGGGKTSYYTPPAATMANAVAPKGDLKGLFSVITTGGINAVAQGYFTSATVVTGSTPHFLKVGITGSGSVKGSPAGITCSNAGGVCTQSLQEGRTVTLTAKAGTGYVFGSWSGCTSSNKTVCTVVMDSDKDVTATFTSDPTISVSPPSKKFPAVKANTTKMVIQIFNVTNKTTKGATGLAIGQIALADNTTDFRITEDGCSNTTVVPNKKCTFKAVFQPLSTGAKNATLHIPSNDPAAADKTVALTGTGN